MSIMPLGWYRLWYEPRKALYEERERLIHVLEDLRNKKLAQDFKETVSSEDLRKMIVHHAADASLFLEKMILMADEQHLCIDISVSGKYEGIISLIEKLEQASLKWLSFSLTATTLSGTLTPAP
jgi:DNA-binding MurR/RpiR family transcriptional regulator